VPSFGQQLETLERWRRFPGLERLEGGAPELALTFDDGPDPDCTPAVLDQLDRAGTRATFFLVGEQVQAHPRLVEEIRARGHAVGVHGNRHVEQDELDDPEADLRAALELVGETALYRPPYGRSGARTHRACSALGLKPVYWSAWGGDWEPVPAERIADLAIRDLAPGAIVLLHDSARYAYRPSALPTAEALPAILAAAAQRGLSFVPLGPT
jgi:peptidoglycan/xylan/chitin deacetylase (PgdA/CDA1 family)